VALAPSATAALRAKLPHFDLPFAPVVAEREALSVVNTD
jgi:hypothetical protein